MNWWLKEKGWSQKDYLAENPAVDSGSLSKILSGTGSVPTLTVAAKYAKGFGLTLAEFYSQRELSEFERHNSAPVAALKRFLTTDASRADVADLVRFIEFKIWEIQRRVTEEAEPPPGNRRLG